MGQIEQQVAKQSRKDRMNYEREEIWVAGISPFDGCGRASTGKTGKKVNDKINNPKQFLNLLRHLHPDMSPLSLIAGRELWEEV